MDAILWACPNCDTVRAAGPETPQDCFACGFDARGHPRSFRQIGRLD